MKKIAWRIAYRWEDCAAILGFMFILVCMILIGSGLANGAEPASGAENGIIAQERVVDLPQDSEKWYLSVVGSTENDHYKALLKWFDEDANLRKFRSMVHYRTIEKGTAVYNERYYPNLKGLPTVRLQKSNGEVVYEAHASALPISAGGLYGILIDSSSKAQGFGLFRPWLNQKRICPVCPKPKPSPIPVPPPLNDPPPAPIDDGGAPSVEPVKPEGSSFDINSAGIGVGAALLLMLTGAGVSLFVQWRKAYRT